MGLSVEAEEGLSHLDGGMVQVLLLSDHLAFAVGVESMRIDGEQFGLKMAEGASDLAEGELELLSLQNGMRLEQVMNGLIGGDKGQTVGQFKAPLAQSASITQAADTHSGFIDQLHGQTWLDGFGGRAAPTQQQIPSAQSQVLRDEQPQAHMVAADFVGQDLAHSPFDAERVAGLTKPLALGAMSFDAPRPVQGLSGVEFFFEARSQ
jgi:hypothetical protein